MADYITTKEYAALHNLNIETVKARIKRKQLPHIKFGSAVMIDKTTPWDERKKTGRIPNAAKSVVENRKLKVVIRKVYYIAVEDSSGKELISDFTFLNKADAERIGAKMKKEVEGRDK
jgi:hypothetical protein